MTMTKISVFPTREQLVNIGQANFTWGWGMAFLVETELGNFQWLSPDYGGDNSLRPFLGDYKDWIKFQGIEFGRSKGHHDLVRYCPNFNYQPDAAIDPER
jgi:hypothetical protein